MLIDSKSAKIEQFLEENMLRDFTIEVHALKNNARMIGAMELSQLFYKMEQLGNEEKKQTREKKKSDNTQYTRCTGNAMKPSYTEGQLLKVENAKNK